MNALPAVIPQAETLAELSAAITAAHVQAQAAANLWLAHATEAGHGLLAARQRLDGSGQWLEWFHGQPFDFRISMAYIYMRIAKYRESLPDSLTNASTAQRALRGLTLAPIRDARPRIEEKDVHSLRTAGWTQKAIAAELDISTWKVHYILNPGYQTRRTARINAQARERREAQVALRRQREAKLVHARGGSTAEAYSLIRRALQRLDDADKHETDKEARSHLRTAMSACHRAEDEIVRALKVGADQRESMASVAAGRRRAA